MARILRPSTGEVSTVTMTDDPSDPCGYCVHWDEQPDDFMGEKAVPYRAPGVVADRMYRMTHDECEKAVAQYVAESSL